MTNTVEAVGAEYLRHDEEKDIYKQIEVQDQNDHLKFVMDFQNDPNAYSTELAEHIKTSTRC